MTLDIEPIVDGLQVSAIGMGMTSVVLVILALSVRGMAWFDARIREREQREKAEAQLDSETSEIPESELQTAESDEGARRAAAIAVAIALSRRASDSVNGSSSMEASLPSRTYDTWLTEGRARQRANRGVAQVGRGRR